MYVVAQRIFQQFASYMEPKAVSIILDKLLANLALASGSNQLVENTAVEILVNLQLKDHISYFISSQSGFISLLNICNCYNMDELDKLILDILMVYVNRPESKSSQSKDRKILTNISEEICRSDPSLSTILTCQSEIKPDLLDVISTDITMNWITNPSTCRISIVDLVIKHSKRHCEYFTTTGISYLSNNVTEANIDLYLPLLECLTFNQNNGSKDV